MFHLKIVHNPRETMFRLQIVHNPHEHKLLEFYLPIVRFENVRLKIVHDPRETEFCCSVFSYVCTVLNRNTFRLDFVCIVEVGTYLTTIYNMYVRVIFFWGGLTTHSTNSMSSL